MTTLTGKEWKDFMGDATVWSPGAFYDDSEVTINGKVFEGDDDEVVATDVIRVYGGVFYPTSNFATENVHNFEAVIKAWKRAQVFDTLVVVIPKDQTAALTEFLKTVGGKVSK